MGIYERLGLRPSINAAGSYSIIGGSRAYPEVMQAMTEASRGFINTVELQRAVGKRLAELTNNEAAFVPLGAAGGLLLAAAAVMIDGQEKWRLQLPNTDGMKDEAIAQLVNKNPYSVCIPGSGMKVKWFGEPAKPTLAELEAAIGPKTACCYYFANPELDGKQLPLKDVVDVCHRHGVPVFVDAAAQIPPIENTWLYTREAGADLAIFSGGKGFHGPQSAGLMVGTAKMIEKVMFVCPPIHSVARTAKASRELIVGMLAAVEVMMKKTTAEVFAQYEERLDTIYRHLQGVPGIAPVKHLGTDVGKQFNHLRVDVDAAVTKISAAQIIRALDDGDPRIAMHPFGERGLYINSEHLDSGEDYIVASRLLEIFKKARAG